MITGKQQFELSFTEGSITPTAVRAKDLASVLRAVETIVTSTVFYDATNETASHVIQHLDDLYVSLETIQSGSLHLAFAPSLPELALSAWNKVIDAVNDLAFTRLSQQTIKAIRVIVNFAKTYDCTATLRYQDANAQAVLTPKTIVADPALLKGNTTLYGYLLRLGGRRPTALITSPRGGIVRVRVNQEIARSLGGRLYSWIGINGVAEWNAETLKVDSFQFSSLAEYIDRPLPQAAHEMREKYGKYFDAIDDVDAMMAELRSE